MARLYKRKEGRIPYSESSQASLPISRNFHMNHLILKLKVTHDNATAVFKDGLANLINNIEVVANGNMVIKSIPGFKLQLNSLLLSGIRGLNTIVTADGTNKESYEYFAIPFVMFGMVRPTDTILNTALFDTLDLRVNWGSSSNLGTGVTVVKAELEIESESLVNYKRNADENIKHFMENALTKEVTASTTEFQINLPTQKLYKSIQLVALDDKVRSNNIIKGIKIKSGTTVFADIEAQTLKAENLMQYRPNNQAELDGVYILNFTQRGKLSDVLNTLKGSGFNTLELVLEVEKQTGTNEILVLQDTIFDTQIKEG